MDEKIMELQNIINDSKRIVFFGGAGVSTESGIPDFRSADGIFYASYHYPPEQVVSHSFFMEHPAAFFEFYKEHMIHLEAQPNAAHLKLAALERAGKLSAIITQNIDGLHQQAGSQEVVELHGSIHRNYCMNCNAFYEGHYDAQYVKSCSGIPRCLCGWQLKPDVVLYEEPLDENNIKRAIAAIAAADTLIIGGTSLAVYPAAGFIDYFRGKKIVVINKGATEKSVGAHLFIDAPIGQVLSNIQV